jgi:hypothetical protein
MLLQVLRKMGSENAHECAQNAENGFGFESFRAIPQDDDDILNQIVRVTNDETRVSFVNVETKEQSKQWMHTQSPNKPERFKQTLSVFQETYGGCFFLGQERCADGEIHATWGHNNVRSALRNTRIAAQGRSEQKIWNSGIRYTCSASP